VKDSLDGGCRAKSEEVELARIHLEKIATGRLTNPNKHLNDFALQLHEIIGHWQRLAGTKNHVAYAANLHLVSRPLSFKSSLS
jgi:hypothetical protein